MKSNSRFLKRKISCSNYRFEWINTLTDWIKPPETSSCQFASGLWYKMLSTWDAINGNPEELAKVKNCRIFGKKVISRIFYFCYLFLGPEGPRTIQQVREDAARDGCIYMPQDNSPPSFTKVANPMTMINPFEGHG